MDWFPVMDILAFNMDGFWVYAHGITFICLTPGRLLRLWGGLYDVGPTLVWICFWMWSQSCFTTVFWPVPPDRTHMKIFLIRDLFPAVKVLFYHAYLKLLWCIVQSPSIVHEAKCTACYTVYALLHWSLVMVSLIFGFQFKQWIMIHVLACWRWNKS